MDSNTPKSNTPHMTPNGDEYAARLTAAEGTVAQLRTRLDTAREALEKTHAAFKHWEGEPVSTGHYNELIWAKEAVTAALASLREEENARMREDGISRFPGFSLRESPIRVQRLGFAWLDQKGQHRRYEMAIMDNHPLMVANQLKQLAEGIEEAHSDPKSPLAKLAPAPAGGKPG